MPPRVRTYAEEAAQRFDTTAKDVMSQSRRKHVCQARGEVMRRLRGDGFSTLQIGRWFGKHHSTVIHWTRDLSPGSAAE